MIPRCALGLARFTVSRLNVKGVPVSTAERSISLTISLMPMLRLESRESFTQSMYLCSHSSP